MRNKDAKLIWISNEKFFEMSSAFLKWPKSFKDLFIKNRTRAVVFLLLFWFEFLWISL